MTDTCGVTEIYGVRVLENPLLPDGQAVAYCRLADGNMAVAVIDLPGGLDTLGGQGHTITHLTVSPTTLRMMLVRSGG